MPGSTYREVTGRDALLFGIQTYSDRCSTCGSDTVPLDPLYPNQMKVCLKCLIDTVADDNTLNELEIDKNNLEEERDSLDDENQRLTADLEKMKKEVDDLTTLLGKKELLISTIQTAHDELMERIDTFDADTQSLRNEIERLRQEADKWKNLALKRGHSS